jgi:arsenical pump membrane protein
MQQTIAYGTLVVVVTLVLALPRTAVAHRIGPASAACLGVAVLMTTGVVGWTDLTASFNILWRPFLTILSIMVTTNVAQRLGILDFFVGVIKPHPGRPVEAVFCSVFILSVVTATALNNDAAVLLLTPPIVGLIRRCYPHRPDLVAPFAFAVFSAAGVAPLVISNPMNMIAAEYAGIGFNEYAAAMTPIALAGWVTTYFILRTIFGCELRLTGGADARTIAAPRLSLPARQFLAVMGVTLACYPTLTYVGGPLWVVAVGSATAGLLLCWRHRVASPQHVAAGLPWEILIFLFGVFVIVLGLQHVGVVGLITELYTSVIGSATQVVVIGISSALGSAVINNHPMAILNALAIRDLPDDTQQKMLAALIGGDLGPRLLPIGSLAGLLWLDSLQRQGVRIDLLRFVLVGAAVTLPTLASSLTILLLDMS